MKKFTIIAFFVPSIALSQAITLSPNTILPLPSQDKGNKEHRTFGGVKKGSRTIGGVTYDAVTGGITTGGTTIYETKTDGAGKSQEEGENISAKVNNVQDGGITTGGITKYSAWILSTNFTVPLVRVNFLVNKPQNATNSLASTSFFNSVGAGFNISLGDLEVTKDASNAVSSMKFYNNIGINLGFLFAANSGNGSSSINNSNTSTVGTSGSPSNSTNLTTTTSSSSTIFAIVGGLSILNFQVGAGYELGSLAPGQRRGFMAISYAIPVSVLVDGGYKLLGINKIKIPSDNNQNNQTQSK